MIYAVEHYPLQCPASTDTFIVMVHDGGGCESRPKLPHRFCGVVSTGSAVGMEHQVGCGDPLGASAIPGPSSQPLDLFHDEHGLPQHGGGS